MVSVRCGLQKTCCRNVRVSRRMLSAKSYSSMHVPRYLPLVIHMEIVHSYLPPEIGLSIPFDEAKSPGNISQQYSGPLNEEQDLSEWSMLSYKFKLSSAPAPRRVIDDVSRMLFGGCAALAQDVSSACCLEIEVSAGFSDMRQGFPRPFAESSLTCQPEGSLSTQSLVIPLTCALGLQARHLLLCATSRTCVFVSAGVNTLCSRGATSSRYMSSLS